MERIAIYTCITGGYDDLHQPYAPDGDDFDFICFVEKGSPLLTADTGLWQVRELPVSYGDAQLDSRYPKMHPHILLPEYEYSVWIDGNILILDSTLYDAARRCREAGSSWAGVTHPSRDCVYAEARKCRDMGYFGWFKLFNIWATLVVNNIPLHDGLLENNLIFRAHNLPLVIDFNDAWWDCYKNFCRRDQISAPLCFKRTGLQWDYLLPQGQNCRNNPGFKYLLHK